MSLPKAWLAWSTGKDSAWALHVLRQAAEVDVVGLLTTVTSEFARVSMHAVREELLDLQAEATGLPCRKVRIPWPCSNEVVPRAGARLLDPKHDLGAETRRSGA
jgi:diphthamide synthase (EF-2-diphthine--ammonia ligase)